MISGGDWDRNGRDSIDIQSSRAAKINAVEVWRNLVAVAIPSADVQLLSLAFDHPYLGPYLLLYVL